MQRMMSAADQATEEWLIASRYLMQISAQLAFSSTKRVLLASQNTHLHVLDASQSESHLYEIFLPTKKTTTARCSLRGDFMANVAGFNIYKWRHSDVIVIKLKYSELNYLQNVYFRFFLFQKLIKWRHLVTDLSNDPRRSVWITLHQLLQK